MAASRCAVRDQGLNVVKAAHESAGKADMTHHFATLSFILEHAPAYREWAIRY